MIADAREDILIVEGLSVQFGGIRAVRGVSFSVAAGELVGIIGPNGAGKTTAMRAITGLVRPQEGRIRLSGVDISRKPVHVRARSGLAFSQQIVRPFQQMSVLENVMLPAAQARLGFGMRAFTSADRHLDREQGLRLLRRLGIEEAAEMRPSEVPLGYLKRLEMARALAIKPKLLLLDEPLAGLNHTEARRLADTIADINRQGITIVLIEHNLREVVKVVRRLIVLEQGQVLAEGEPAATIAMPKVQMAYLGKDRGHAAA